MLRPPPHQTAARGRKKTHPTAAPESPSPSLPPRGSTTPRVTDHHLRGSTSTSPSLSSSHHRLQGSSSASSSLSSSLSLPQRSSTITSQVVQKLNDVIKLRNEELEAKEETIRKLRNEELEAKEETIRKLSERLLSELSERLLLEQRISGLVKSQADKNDFLEKKIQQEFAVANSTLAIMNSEIASLESNLKDIDRNHQLILRTQWDQLAELEVVVKEEQLMRERLFNTIEGSHQLIANDPTENVASTGEDQEPATLPSRPDTL